MAIANYGMTTRPGATRRTPTAADPNDPQQQALMAALQQNGVDPSAAPDPTASQPIDNNPTKQFSGLPGGPSRSTMPVGMGGVGGMGGGIGGGWQRQYGGTGMAGMGMGGPLANNPNTGVAGGGIGGNGGIGSAVRQGVAQGMAGPSAPGSTASSAPSAPSSTSSPTAPAPDPSASATSPAAPDGLGSFSGQMSGFDSGKLNDPNKHDPKYDFARVASNYDPTQGISQAMVDQLNSLGDGTWGTSGGDALTYNGQNIDAIQGLKGGSGTWAWQPEDGSGGGAAPGGGSSVGALGMGAGMSSLPAADQITQLQSQAGQGDTYSQMVLKYLMQSLGLDQAMMKNS